MIPDSKNLKNWKLELVKDPVFDLKKMSSYSFKMKELLINFKTNFLNCLPINFICLIVICVFDFGSLRAEILDYQNMILFSIVPEHILLENSTIVPKGERFEEDEARRALARIWARNTETLNNALEQFTILQQEGLHDELLELEIEKVKYDLEHVSESKLQASSLVPINEWMSDFDARHTFAKLLAYHEKTWDQAIDQYKILIAKAPRDVILLIEIANIYNVKRQYELAVEFLHRAIALNPNEKNVLIELAKLEASLGYAKRSRRIFQQLLTATQNQEEIWLAYADSMMFWGDFYQAESIFRSAIRQNPTSFDLQIRLVGVYLANQRFEELEGLLKKFLIRFPEHKERLLTDLAVLKIIQQNYKAALSFANELLKIKPAKEEFVELKAKILFLNQNYPEAIQLYSQLSQNKAFYIKGILGIAKSLLKIGEKEKGVIYLSEVIERDPQNIEARYYLTDDSVSDTCYIEKIIASTRVPQDLQVWAELYSEDGWICPIIQLNRAAIEKDPGYFPSYTALAEALATVRQYQSAYEIYSMLLQDFDRNPKLMLGIARVISWDKQYDASIDLYDELIALDPSNSVPKREQARVAFWAHRDRLSVAMYNELLFPSVDQAIFKELLGIESKISRRELQYSLEMLAESVNCGSIYRGYEDFVQNFDYYSEQFIESERKIIEEILADYLGLYIFQKITALEMFAEQFTWNKMFIHAANVYKEMMSFDVGNPGIEFEYAQTLCILGLCQSSMDRYEDVIERNPLNLLAVMSLQRALQKEDLGLQTKYTYWKEIGFGVLSQISRYRADISLEIPISCSQRCRLMQHRWLEHTFYDRKFHSANGQTFEWENRFNVYAQGKIGVTRKQYLHQFPTTYTGFAETWLRITDCSNLGLGFKMTDEIFNFFNLCQKTQAKIWWTTFSSNITHCWEASSTVQHYDYSDRNGLVIASISSSWALTEHPKIFKVILYSEYRNTVHTNKYIYNSAGKLINIIHPYWAPQHYFAGNITFEWYHDLSTLLFCGAPLTFYDIKVSFGDDTEQDPALEVNVEWQYEFYRHWRFGVKGLLHRSPLWNAKGLWCTLNYQF